MERKGDFIKTHSGINFYPLDPRPEEILIEDIAHALSNLCRFTGHCPEFYSVAQHSAIVSRLVKPQYALHALLHDASEAYICDIARPVKREPEMKPYLDIERVLQAAIYRKFGLDENEPGDVKYVDTRILVTEACMFNMLAEDCALYDVERFDIAITPAEPKIAKQLFIDRFHELVSEE